MIEEKALILKNEQIAKDTYLMSLKSKMTSLMKAGQFVNVACRGFMLKRPISIHNIEDEYFEIIYKVVGDGTKVLSQMKVNEEIEIFGPLGSSYPIHEELDEVLLIGGGVGVPPLYQLAKNYRNLNKKVYVVLGFNDIDSIFGEDKFKQLGCNCVVATMSGSYGIKGTVMDAIKASNISCDFTYSCGPIPMLKAVEANYQKGYMSFEARMACGIGACMACVAKDKKEENLYHRICKEGPVFPIGKVVI